MSINFPVTPPQEVLDYTTEFDSLWSQVQASQTAYFTPNGKYMSVADLSAVMNCTANFYSCHEYCHDGTCGHKLVARITTQNPLIVQYQEDDGNGGYINKTIDLYTWEKIEDSDPAKSFDWQYVIAPTE